MATFTVNPTANETPDSGQGGLAVTGNTNTGHASTVTSVGVGATQTKTCRWSGFQSVGQATAITLKIDHTSDGALGGVDAENDFSVQYSLNGGSSWTIADSRTNFTGSQGPTTFSAALSAAQDISQVQVRVRYLADTLNGGASASVTATIANIKLEVTTVDASLVVMM